MSFTPGPVRRRRLGPERSRRRGSRYSSRCLISPAPSAGSPTRRSSVAGLLLVDPRKREADVHEHPVARLRLRGERDAHVAADAGDVDACKPVVEERNDLAGDAETHVEASVTRPPKSRISRNPLSRAGNPQGDPSPYRCCPGVPSRTFREKGANADPIATEAVVLAAADLDSLSRRSGAAATASSAPPPVTAAIVLDELDGPADLPVGWTDEQAPGSYRLARRDDDAVFGYAVGPHSWKRELLPPRVRLWQARRERRRIRDRGGARPRRSPPRFSASSRARWRRSRSRIACSSAAASRTATTPRDAPTCSSSPSTAATPPTSASAPRSAAGPGATDGFDLALTELLDGDHRFLVRAGSPAGKAVLAELPTQPAPDRDVARRAEIVAGAADEMAGRFEPDGLHALLTGNLESPHWDVVAERCLSCGNCTLACPTCFCTHVEDTSALDGVDRRAHPRLGHVLLGRLRGDARRQHAPGDARALPPVADAQARDVAGPVRDARLRRLRPLHRLVPRRDRHPRGGAVAPRPRRTTHAHA